MKKTLCIICIITLALTMVNVMSCATFSFHATESRQVPDDFLGISPDRSPLQEKDYALLDELGVTWTRRTLRWSGVEPEPGKWNFDYWDKYVDNGKAAGKKLLITLGFDNPYLYKDRKEHRDLTEKELPFFLEYVEKTVLRYKGRVDAWEIWNEPNLHFWRGSDVHFFDLAKAAAQRIREVDPTAKIVSAAFWRTPKKFIRGMFETGAMEYVDAISFHPYALNPRGAVKLYDNLVKILDDYGFKGEIWSTEVGYPTSGVYPTRVNEKNFPGHIVKTIAGLAARGSKTVIWYELQNDNNKGQEPSKLNSEAFFGIVYPDLSYRNGAYAYRLCARYIAGSEYVPAQNIPQFITALFFRSKGGNILILWSEKPLKAQLVIDGGIVPYVHSIDSSAPPLSAPDALTITHTPIFLTWEGDAAGFQLIYPLINKNQ
ncbi:MAG: family 1 glycosylhydrolase [Treponema sp.]|jgi:hypothetical protein|nr:family 1 glycosylhydrolase [Treponema sp.]